VAKTKLNPLGDRVLIKKNEAPKEKGGIMLPDTATDSPYKVREGTVVAVGIGRRLKNGEYIKPPVEVGDQVIVSKFEGTAINIDDEVYFVVDSDKLEGRFE
jgi:chaperonin GroES